MPESLDRSTEIARMRGATVDGERFKGCRRGFRGHRRLHSIRAIIQDYMQQHEPRAAEELGFFRQMPNLARAITEAGLARRPDGKRWNHQRRIPALVLERATRQLRQAALGGACSFADLIARVDRAVRSIHGVGELYVYDTALRIGAHLRLLPTEVYLHAGARVGARALGVEYRAAQVPLDQLPPGLRRLEAYEVEDVLCIYKDWLVTAKGV